MNEAETPRRSAVPRRMRTLFRVRLVLLAVSLVSSILVLASVVETVPGVIAFAGSAAVYTALSLVLWRCPSCGKYPGNAVMPDYCEQCGAAIFGPDARLPDRLPTTGEVASSRLRWILISRTAYGLALLVYFALQSVIDRYSVFLFWAVAMLMLAGGVWIEWKWWRCPHCGGYLRRRLWPGRACSKCGGELRL